MYNNYSFYIAENCVPIRLGKIRGRFEGFSENLMGKKKKFLVRKKKNFFLVLRF
jgi:hypothetical protein